VTVRQLYENERKQFRGQIVHVSGQLKRWKKIPANAELQKEGIAELYEGWIEDAFTFDKPICVIFIDPPQGIAPTGEIKDAVYVVLDGYSFKRVKDPVYGLAPLLIGRSLKRLEPASEATAAAALDPRSQCPPEWLEHIEDDVRPQNGQENADEFSAYNYFVLRARQIPLDLMAKHARRELTFGLLFDKGRAKYRGEIVHVEGRLKRLRWIDTTTVLERDGVKDLYEAWIFRDGYYSNPTCVIISELPPGLTPAEDIQGTWASFDGYFFKRYRYDAADKHARLAPLAIGRSLTLRVPPVNGDGAWAFQAYADYFIPVAIAFAVVVVIAVIGISRYFRRGDRAVRARLEQRRSMEFIEPPSEPFPARQPPIPFDLKED
jgi:hypothetical protein